MKIWYPLNMKETNIDDQSRYILKCSLEIGTIRSFLRSNINSVRWNALTDKLQDIEEIEFTKKVSALTIANQYISNLQCFYDAPSSMCYYMVPDMIRCIGTNTSLNKVIRFIEYGTVDIKPMNWIRHSYNQFTDFILEEYHKYEC